jgi:hypothetical protein
MSPWLELLLNVIALAGFVVVATYYRPSKKHDGQLHWEHRVGQPSASGELPNRLGTAIYSENGLLHDSVRPPLSSGEIVAPMGLLTPDLQPEAATQLALAHTLRSVPASTPTAAGGDGGTREAWAKGR